MANEEHVKILKQGVEVWNKWREETLAKPDLRIANLSGATLSGADLKWADLSGANLDEADLYRADLSGANLEGANLYRTDLTGADLTGANLREAKNLTQKQIDSAITDEDTKLPGDLK